MVLISWPLYLYAALFWPLALGYFVYINILIIWYLLSFHINIHIRLCAFFESQVLVSMCPNIYLISVFALTFCVRLYWNLPSPSNCANLNCYHLKHYVCHLIEVPYFLPFYTIHFYIGHFHYLYSHHICP